MSDEIIQVDPMDPSKKSSKVSASLREESTVILDTNNPQCFWNDTEVPDGGKVCENGQTFECQMGSWIKLNKPC